MLKELKGVHRVFKPCIFCIADDFFSPSGVKYPNKASSISLISKGPTAGLLSPTNVVQKPVPIPKDDVTEVTFLSAPTF